MATASVIVRPLLIIFDLNGTLVFKPKRRNGTDDAAKGPGAVGDVVQRPYLELMLDMVHEMDQQGLVRCAVWSSSERSRVNRTVNSVFPAPMIERLLFRFDRGRCLTVDGFGGGRRRGQPLIKNLKIVWDMFNGAFDDENTIIVDDTRDKVYYSQRRCLYLVPTFDALDDNDSALLKFNDYLKERVALDVAVVAPDIPED